MSDQLSRSWPCNRHTCRAARGATGMVAAFTLVELLLVVALLALLISILLPSLSQGREVAKRAVCLTQLRQVYLASVEYAASHYQRYPPRPASFSQYHVANFDPGSGKDSYSMGLKLLVDQKLIGPAHLFCPSDKIWSAAQHWPHLSFGASWKPYLSSYAQREENQVLDRFTTRNAPQHGSFYADWFTTAIPANPWATHNAGWNVSYFDGAAGWQPRTDAIWAGIIWTHDFTGQGQTWRRFDR